VGPPYPNKTSRSSNGIQGHKPEICTPKPISKALSTGA